MRLVCWRDGRLLLSQNLNKPFIKNLCILQLVSFLEFGLNIACYTVFHI